MVSNHDLSELPLRLLLPRIMNRQKRIAFELALAGIATALALISLVLYYFSPFAKISFLALSAVALLLPLTADKVRSSALAYVACGGLAIAIMGPLAALPFIFIFGWQPVLLGVCDRYLKGKWYISLPLKAALFNAGLYGTYTLYGLGDTVTNALSRLGWAPAYWIIALLATALFLLYDYAMEWVYRWLYRRLDKVTAKYRTQPPPTDGAQNRGTSPTQSDIFGESEGDETSEGDDKA